MKKTRKDLVEFLNKTRRSMLTDGCTIEVFNSFYADALIKSGFVQVEAEPREFWLLKHEGEAFYRTTHIHPDCWHQNKEVLKEIIHVHSVDQCRKYEKIWKEFKRRLIEAKPGVKYFEEAYELMKELEKGE